jgi:peptidoglycan/LPS O-acetylase OafA/YrhL
MQHALNPAPTEENNKLLGLEALRFVTAFAILVFHYRHFSFVADKPVDLVPERLPLYGLLKPFHDSGSFGVWVFWCISGFIFFWKYRDAIAGRSISGWKFFTLRFSRLYPLHLVTLLAVALLQSFYFNLHGYFFVYQDNDLLHFLTQLFMASEWGLTAGLSFDGPVWSVSVEVLVYLFFFLFLLVSRLWFLNAIFAAWLGVALFNVNGQIGLCLAFFYIGGLAALARRAVEPLRLRRMLEAGVWFVVLVVGPFVVFLLSDQLDRFKIPLFIVYTPVLVFCLSREIAVPRVLQSMIVAAGNMTYSSYLLHFPLQLLIVLCFALAGRPVPLYDGALFIVYLLTTLLLSYVTFRFFEAPAQRSIRAALRKADRPAQGAFRRASSA